MIGNWFIEVALAGGGILLSLLDGAEDDAAVADDDDGCGGGRGCVPFMGTTPNRFEELRQGIESVNRWCL
jgi:hypothetical protein